MRNNPVHWAEGMFLRPQHFQAADQYWHEYVGTSTRWNCHYHYGLRSIEISPEALGNNQLQVRQLSARMVDGTVVDLQSGQELDRVDLKPAFEQQDTVVAYLAIPRLVLGRANVGRPSRDADHRFLPFATNLQDESQGGNDQPVELKSPNLRIVLTGQDASGMELLPIARITRASATGAVPVVDTKYIPPLLAIDAWERLHVGYVREISDYVHKFVEVLAAVVADRGVSLASQQPGDLDDLFKLSILNQASASLRVLAFAQGVHPFAAYLELCRILGMLAIFDETRRLTEPIPVYDHDNLAEIFEWVDKRIRDLMKKGKITHYERRDFIGRSNGMAVRLEPRWLHDDWTWFVGVSGDPLTENEIRESLGPKALHWKAGSDSRVDQLFKMNLPDLSQTPLRDTPTGLPANKGWVYYRVQKEGPEWRHVLAEQSLAVRFNEGLIVNRDKLPGSEHMEVDLKTKRAVMRFSLFAVKSSQS